MKLIKKQTDIPLRITSKDARRDNKVALAIAPQTLCIKRKNSLFFLVMDGSYIIEKCDRTLVIRAATRTNAIATLFNLI